MTRTIKLQIISRRADGKVSTITITDTNPVIANANDEEVAALLLSTEVRANCGVPQSNELPSVRVHISAH